MEKVIKNIDSGIILNLSDEVAVLPGQIVSKTLAQSSYYTLTLFAFDQDEEISTHESEGDALLSVLEGSARVLLDGEEHLVKAGETILMPRRVPHAVYALEAMKMHLLVVFPDRKS